MASYPCPNFPLNSNFEYSRALVKHGILDFHQALDWVRTLPYKRISDLENLALVAEEKRGTCSTKHGFLAAVARENGHPEIHVELGYFRFSKRKIPALTQDFDSCGADYLIEAHCYLKFNNHIIDVTASSFDAQQMLRPKELIESRRLAPEEVGEYKQKLHFDYFQKWCEGKKLNFEQVWALRWKVIDYLVQKASR